MPVLTTQHALPASCRLHFSPLFNALIHHPAAGAVLGAAWGLVAALAGRSWGRYQAKRKFERRDFLDRLHVSLNMLGGGQLRIRTVVERPLADVVLNEVVKNKITAAARRATSENPILMLPEQDASFVYNCVINTTAEHFCSGCVRADSGHPVNTTVYALFLTCEPVSDMRQQKIRAVLVKRQHLIEFPYADSVPQLEHKWHSDRVNTLRCAAALYKTRPELFSHMYPP